MNIFAVYPCPKQSARYLDDLRVIKMTLETTQLLCSALNLRAGKQIAPYKTVYPNNACTQWAQASIYNWIWLHQHGLALATEFKKRRGKSHACQSVLEGIEELALLYLPFVPLQPFLNKTTRKDLDIDYTFIDDVHEAYERYLKHRWSIAKRPPTWYGETRST